MVLPHWYLKNAFFEKHNNLYLVYYQLNFNYSNIFYNYLKNFILIFNIC